MTEERWTAQIKCNRRCSRERNTPTLHLKNLLWWGTTIIHFQVTYSFVRLAPVQALHLTSVLPFYKSFMHFSPSCKYLCLLHFTYHNQTKVTSINARISENSTLEDELQKRSFNNRTCKMSDRYFPNVWHMLLKYCKSNTLSRTCLKLAMCMTGVSRHVKKTEVLGYTFWQIHLNRSFQLLKSSMCTNIINKWIFLKTILMWTELCLK